MLPFSFSQVVPEVVVKRRAENLETQAAGLPWNDWTDFHWTDFRDEAERELFDEL